MIFILHLRSVAWIQGKAHTNCPMKLRVHVGWIETEWHDHDLDGAVQWVTNSSTICITMYHLTMKLWRKGSLFWEPSPDRGNCGEKRWDFSCFVCPQSLSTQRLLCASPGSCREGRWLTAMWSSGQPPSLQHLVPLSPLTPISSRAKQYCNVNSRAWPFRMINKTTGQAACPCVTGSP